MNPRSALLAAIVLTATACSAPEDVAVSQACSDAFEEAADSQGAAANDLLVSTLTVCDGYDEWLRALRDEPAALGLTGGADIGGPMEVANFCHGADGPVCEDARDRGIID